LDPTLLTVIVLTIIGLPVLICLMWGINRKRTRPFATLIQLTALTFGVLICFKEGRSDYTKSAIIAFVAGVLLTGLAIFQIQRMRKAKALLNSQQSATGQRRSVTHAS
jgi:ABC-type spermidine/putrescine transport system permease subunit II